MAPQPVKEYTGFNPEKPFILTSFNKYGPPLVGAAIHGRTSPLGVQENIARRTAETGSRRVQSLIQTMRRNRIDEMKLPKPKVDLTID